MRRLLVPLLALALAVPASALDLPTIVCTCADDARTRGDWVACVSLLTQRLVASGDMTARERAVVVRQAARGGPPADPDCDEAGPPQWGIAAQADRQPLASGSTARFEGILWNFTGELVTGLGGRGGGGAEPGSQCLFNVTLVDSAGAVVHHASNPCPAAVTEYPLEPGLVRRFAYDVPLVYFNSETADPDGVPLPPGPYRAVVTTLPPYPERVATWNGLPASAELPLIVED